ncbi:TRAP transporter small permease [Azospirillum sp. RWY-5-1]|uniref:TRAP transporter small permease protein n=1 Tax=Azospirillum oleiclasticum TaxID=2735135 RepID=A0ABX2TJT2_9PROT|nr:TRAP transporter small permease [Azospirillum oleiclasticum]NYZ14519.1 TRAP transporter small permease [Azospirillum oleiclasticum]NYZ24297.1 TRAP transporter small permease [Azospirillum oleiclasticum]
MDSVTQHVWTVARFVARASGLLVVLMALLISADILARQFLNATLLSGGVGELAGYALAAVSAWGASLTLLKRAHIRIDTVQALLPRPLSIALDLFAMATFAIASGVLAWMGWGTFARSFALDSRSMTPLAAPLAVPQGIWLAGLAFLTLTAVVLLVQAVRLLLRGERRAALELVGTRTATEDLEEQKSVVESSGVGGARA